MATNHKPVIKGTDHGIWRRIKLIPFTTRIPEEKHLELKLHEEASCILNWLLEGTARWKRERLKAPVAVLKATDDYRGEMDVIGIVIRMYKNYPVNIINPTSMLNMQKIGLLLHQTLKFLKDRYQSQK
jgi:phage/plasmid-associated DNA primase